MAILDAVIAPVAKLLDKIIPDPQARDQAKLALLKLEGAQELDVLRVELSAIIAEAQSADPWTSRARPSFLYVMYVLLLWSIPMGLISAVKPDMSQAIAFDEEVEHVLRRPNMEVTEEGDTVVITLPSITITIKQNK